MRRVLTFCLLAGWAALLAAPLATALRAAEEEALAGQEIPTSRTSKPAVQAPEAGAPFSLTRQPSTNEPFFKLPEMVITGEGEAKMDKARGEFRLNLDTTEGVRASPGEQGASKNQAGAQSGKLNLEEVTYTARTSYGHLEGSWGTADTGLLDLLFGQELGAWDYLVQAGGRQSDGAPVAATLADGTPLGDRNPSWRRGRILGQVSWQVGARNRLQAQVSGDERQLALPYITQAGQDLERARQSARLTWEGTYPGLFNQTINLRHDEAQLLLPGQGQAFQESLTRLRGRWEKDLSLDGGGFSLSLDGNLGYVGQSAALGAGGLGQGFPLGGLEFHDRFAPFTGAHLGLGLGLSWVGGDHSGFLLAPLLDWEERINSQVDLFVSFNPGQTRPFFSGALFEQDPVLPNPALNPSQDDWAGRAGLRGSWFGSLSLELAGFARQTENTIVLDDPAGRHLWSPVNTGRSRVAGGDLDEQYAFLPGFEQFLQLRLQQGTNLDDPSLHLTYLPQQRVRLGVKGAWGAFLGQASLDALAARYVSQTGSAQAPASLGLNLKLGWQAREWLEVFVQGDNLLAQDVEDWWGYPEARPTVGAGVDLYF